MMRLVVAAALAAQPATGVTFTPQSPGFITGEGSLDDSARVAAIEGQARRLSRKVDLLKQAFEHEMEDMQKDGQSSLQRLTLKEKAMEQGLKTELQKQSRKLELLSHEGRRVAEQLSDQAAARSQEQLELQTLLQRLHPNFHTEIDDAEQKQDDALVHVEVQTKSPGVPASSRHVLDAEEVDPDAPATPPAGVAPVKFGWLKRVMTRAKVEDEYARAAQWVASAGMNEADLRTTDGAKALATALNLKKFDAQRLTRAAMGEAAELALKNVDAGEASVDMLKVERAAYRMVDSIQHNVETRMALEDKLGQTVDEESMAKVEQAPPSEIQVVTVDFDSSRRFIPLSGVSGKFLRNLARTDDGASAGTPNAPATILEAHQAENFAKMRVFLDWLKAEETQDANQLVIFTEASQVFYGGCSDKDLFDRYRKIVKATGNATVVLGASMGLESPPIAALVDPFKDFERRRQKVLATVKLNEASYRAAALCQVSRTDATACSVPSFMQVTASPWPCRKPCSDPPALTYTNADFIMGPVGSLREAVEGLLRYATVPHDVPYRSNWAEEGALTMFMTQRPDKITLDYTGSLFLDLAQMRHDMAVRVDTTSGILHNVVAGVRQCFVRADGPALKMLGKDLPRLVPAATPEKATNLLSA